MPFPPSVSFSAFYRTVPNCRFLSRSTPLCRTVPQRAPVWSLQFFTGTALVVDPWELLPEKIGIGLRQLDPNIQFSFHPCSLVGLFTLTVFANRYAAIQVAAAWIEMPR